MGDMWRCGAEMELGGGEGDATLRSEGASGGAAEELFDCKERSDQSCVELYSTEVLEFNF